MAAGADVAVSPAFGFLPQTQGLRAGLDQKPGDGGEDRVPLRPPPTVPTGPRANPARGEAMSGR